MVVVMARSAFISGRAGVDHGLGLDFHPPARIDQAGHHHHGRGGSDVAEDGGVRRADGLDVGSVGQIHPRAHDLFDAGPGRGQGLGHDRPAALGLSARVRIAATVGLDRRGASYQDPIAHPHRPAEPHTRLIR